ncbi:GPR1/FUN34/yaaH family-domain-containing protein [Jackrogersella minutella]|nr:GPR1/FUN34/yaaH family-domain-containing protein [Jackrogersella minutella]
MSITMSVSEGKTTDLEKQATISPREQVGLPYVPRAFANPAPLGLLSFATSIFMISLLGLEPRGVKAPNIIIPNMVFFGGAAQFIAGIMEFVAGNTLGATLFTSYAAFNLAYALIFLPGSGIIAAYSDPSTGALIPEFDQAIAMFVWAWFIISMIFTVATVRSSWTLLGALVFVDITLILLAVGYMLGQEQCLKAASATGFITAALAYWAGTAGLWGDGITPFTVPVGSLKRE